MPTTTSEVDLNALADAAIATARMAAVARLRVNHAIPTDDLDGIVKDEVAKALPEALDDAKEALECGMTDAALQTFSASMAIAGIAAANRACLPVVAR